MKAVNTGSLKLILAIMCFVCLLDMPYGYYQFFRLFAFFTFFVFIFHDDIGDKMGLFWIFSALLFQPFIKVNLGREIWYIVDIIYGILLIYLFVKRLTSKKESY